MIHCDIRGLAPVLSWGGWNHYILFVNNYRYCWDIPTDHCMPTHPQTCPTDIQLYQPHRSTIADNSCRHYPIESVSVGQTPSILDQPNGGT